LYENAFLTTFVVDFISITWS